MATNIIISKNFTFEASHVLPKHPGKCSRLHGHSWQLEVSVIGPVQEDTGFVCDYGDLKKLVEKEIIDRMDHQHLGHGWGARIVNTKEESIHTDFKPPFGLDFYPSSENLVKAIARLLQPLVPEALGGHVSLYSVRLNETCTSAAVWYDTISRKGYA